MIKSRSAHKLERMKTILAYMQEHPNQDVHISDLKKHLGTGSAEIGNAANPLLQEYNEFRRVALGIYRWTPEIHPSSDDAGLIAALNRIESAIRELASVWK